MEAQVLWGVGEALHTGLARLGGGSLLEFRYSNCLQINPRKNACHRWSSIALTTHDRDLTAGHRPVAAVWSR